MTNQPLNIELAPHVWERLKEQAEALHLTPESMAQGLLDRVLQGQLHVELQRPDDYKFLPHTLQKMLVYKPSVVFDKGKESDPLNKAFVKRFAQFETNHFTRNGISKTELCNVLPDSWHDATEQDLIDLFQGRKVNGIIAIHFECPQFMGTIFTCTDGSGVAVGHRWVKGRKENCICAYDPPDEFMDLMTQALFGQDDDDDDDDDDDEAVDEIVNGLIEIFGSPYEE